MNNRVTVSTGAPWEETVGYCRAVRVGNHVAVSGTAPVGDDGEVVGVGDAYVQARRCIEIIERALASARLTARRLRRFGPLRAWWRSGR